MWPGSREVLVRQRASSPYHRRVIRPLHFLLLLVIVGAMAALFLWKRPARAPDSAPVVEDVPMLSQNPLLAAVVDAAPAPPPETMEGLRKQITLMEGQVEYLQGQVKALQDENAELIEKLGTLGIKGMPKSMSGATTPALTEPNGNPPDFVSLSLELMSLRQMQAAPVVIVPAPLEEVEKKILAWLRKRHPGDEPVKFGKALAAAGFIPEAIDPLPLRAALSARQLGGWYEAVDDTLYLVEPAGDTVLALCHGHLLRQFGKTLFPDDGARLSTDAMVARGAVIGGDAALTRFLQSLQKPVPVSVAELPADDPDHPFNQVPLPVFLRELHLFSFTRGFEFAQSLHSAGGFKQVNGAYQRPPVSSAEVIDPELYLVQEPPQVVKIEGDAAVSGAMPYWDDCLGKFAAIVALKAYNPDEIAFDAAKGWRADRLLSYSADGSPRNHAVWQIALADANSARLFFKAMRDALHQRHDQPADDAQGDAPVMFSANGRSVRLSYIRQGTGLLFIDAASEAFASAAAEKFGATSK